MKKITLFAIILFLILPMTKSTGEVYREEDLLLNILEDFNANFLEGDINIGGTISNEFKYKKEIIDLSNEVIDDLGIIGSEADINRDITNLKGKYYIKEFIEDENSNQVSIYGYDKANNPISVVLMSYFDSETGKSETNLFINLIKQEKNLEINGIIDNVYRKYGKPVDNTTCIIGTVEGRLDKDNLEANIKNILKKYKAKVVEKYQDEEVISYTAFTPYINNDIFSNEKKVNLNLAVRYNEYENKTYFWIATPIIATGY